MSSTQNRQDRVSIPKIVIEDTDSGESRPSPEEEASTSRPRLPRVRVQARTAASIPQPTKKRSASVAEISGSETETEKKKMSSKVSKHSEMGSKKHHSSKPKSKSTKTDDWSDITEPEERRRIQNRIAQRKFREKARDNKERSEREAQNQAHAGSSYHIPTAAELSSEQEETGLPWGGLSMSHIVSRGHDTESRRSSGRGEYLREDTRYLSPYGGGYGQQTSYGSSGGEEIYYEEETPSYYYDPEQRR